jgi:YgiT-type zinc finger domain-containing protein
MSTDEAPNAPSSPQQCPRCHADCSPGSVTYSEETDGSVFVVMGVPAVVCSVCGDARMLSEAEAALRAVLHRRRELVGAMAVPPAWLEALPDPRAVPGMRGAIRW